jgi:hypothetical protein
MGSMIVATSFISTGQGNCLVTAVNKLTYTLHCVTVTTLEHRKQDVESYFKIPDKCCFKELCFLRLQNQRVV